MVGVKCKMVDEMGRERSFSLELKSKASLRNVTLTNGGNENVLVEGTIGELCCATFQEGTVLEIVGRKGILRIDLCNDEITASSKIESKEARN